MAVLKDLLLAVYSSRNSQVKYRNRYVSLTYGQIIW